jgi:hypothetical protein
MGMVESQRAALISMMGRYAEANTVSKKVAFDSLVKEGIYTEDGKVAPEYGGEPKKKKKKSSSKK